jgi:hypothetical protein
MTDVDSDTSLDERIEEIDTVSPLGIRMSHLRALNFIAGVAHFLQAAFMGIAHLSTYVFPVIISHGTAIRVLTHVPSVIFISGSSLISSAFHFAVVHPRVFPAYSRGICSQTNYFRWMEYSVSSSLMLVLIAQLVGIYNIGVLASFFALNSSMIFFGWLQERYEFPGTGGLSPFYFGCFAGAVPWIVMGGHMLSFPGGLPAYAYEIYASIFVLFSCFAGVQYCQYKCIWIFKDYFVGEAVYILLSIVAKSLLAWETYFGALMVEE